MTSRGRSRRRDRGEPQEIRIVGMPAPVPVAQTVERDKTTGAIKRTVTRALAG